MRSRASNRRNWPNRHPRRIEPPDTLGIKRKLPQRAKEQDEAKRFALGKTGELRKQFKPIVTKPPNKGPGFDL